MQFNLRNRQRIAAELRGVVDDSPDWFLRAEDLAIRFDETGGFTAWYVFDPAFAYVCAEDEDENGNRVLRVTTTPGETYDQGMYHCSDVDQVIAEIRKWVVRLDDDLQALPMIRELEAHSRRLRALEAAVEQFADEYPTGAEYRDMLRRLDELEELLAGHIREDAENEAEGEKEIDKLRAEVEVLRQSVANLTQRGFVRWVCARLFAFARRPQAAAEITAAFKTAEALSAGVKALGE